MKKTVLILFFATLSVVGYSNDSTSAKSILPDSSKLTMNKVYEDAKDGIKGLASALKIGAEHVYAVLVMQQIVKSFIFSIVFILSAIAFWVGYKNYKSVVFVRDNYGDITIKAETVLNMVFCIVLCLAGLVMLIVSLANTEAIITGFINPEYGAIKDIMQFVK